MVAGEWVRAAKVDITYEISGDLTGTWAETLWLRADDWLPLRIEHNLELQGLAALRESFHLELTSLKSTRLTSSVPSQALSLSLPAPESLRVRGWAASSR